jgi:mono/diheme cytochrome c family protein
MTRWVLVALAVFAFGVEAADRKAVPWAKSRLAAGQSLYRENCIVCHDIETPKSKKPGPSLHHLFKNPRLPLSRGKPNRPYVITRIKFGGPLMPAYRQKLTDAEINLILEYIESK